GGGGGGGGRGGGVGAAEGPGARRHQGDRARPSPGQGLRAGPGEHAGTLREPGARGDGGAGAGGEDAMITIDQFRTVELKVGTVRAAEPHPKADRLLVLRVDVGGEERQLVAGIRAHYDPAALVGRQVVVVANLEPAKLRGVESQGMVLAAADEANNRVVLLRPDDAVTPGAVVR